MNENTTTTNWPQYNGTYKCRLCGGHFLRGSISCCVAHPPGTCCHYGDKRIEVDEQQAKDLRRANLRPRL